MAGPAVIADAYDLYADQLYAYCRFLVRDPVEAVNLLEDIFLVAAGRGAALPSDGQMRTWLFAVARNGCVRSVRSRRPAPGPGSRSGETDDGRTERALIAAAAEGLAQDDRDLVALLWHGLDADDIAMVFGISREESFPLLDRALIRLEEATSALLVARSGRHGCGDLAALLRGWDGRLDVPLVRTLTQHVERCRACSARRQGELRPAIRLSLTPAALLGTGVSAEALRSAAATVGVLREQVLNLACDPSGEGAGARARACGQAGPFGLGDDSVLAQGARAPQPPRVGFPVPLPAEPVRRVPRKRLGAALTGAAAVAAAVTATVVIAGGQAPASGSGLTGASGGSASAVTVSGLSSQPSTVPPSASPSPSAKPAPRIDVPSSVTLRWNDSQADLEGTLTVTVSGGPVHWTISAPNRGLRLSQVSGTTSASVEVSGRSRSPRPLTVTAGSVSTTVALAIGH